MSRLKEMGLDPNRPISKYDLLQLEGNRNINLAAPTAKTVEAETTPEWELFVSPPLAMKQEQWEEYVEDLNKAQEDEVSQEIAVEPVLEVKVEVPPEKPKNALKELEKLPKKQVSVKKKSKKETS